MKYSVERFEGVNNSVYIHIHHRLQLDTRKHIKYDRAAEKNNYPDWINEIFDSIIPINLIHVYTTSLLVIYNPTFDWESELQLPMLDILRIHFEPGSYEYENVGDNPSCSDPAVSAYGYDEVIKQMKNPAGSRYILKVKKSEKD